MKKPSKIVLFVIFSLLAVAATVVIVKVFFPEPDIKTGYTSIVSILENDNQQKISNSIENIAISLNEKASTDFEKELGNYLLRLNDINKSILNNYNNMKIGNMFVKRTSNFNTNAKSILAKLDSLQQKYQKCYDYINEVYASYIASDNVIYSDLKTYVNTITNNFIDIIKIENEININLCNIYLENVNISFQNNMTCKLSCKATTIWVNQLLNKPKSTVYQTAELLSFSLNNRANETFDTSYALTNLYNKLYNNNSDFELLIENIQNNTVSNYVNSKAEKTDYERFVNLLFHISISAEV